MPVAIVSEMTNSPSQDGAGTGRGPRLLARLVGLKRELWRLFWAYLLAFLVANALSDELLVLWRWPLASVWEGASSPFALYGVMDLFMVKLWLAVFGGALLVLPYLAWRLHKTFGLSLWGLLLGVFLFYGGVAFAWALLTPALWRFLIAYSLSGAGLLFSAGPAPTDVLQLSLETYSALMRRVLGGVGLLFLLPWVLVWLGRLGLINPAMIARKRPYAILLLALLAALLAPEMSLFFFLFLPLYFLFELALLGARLAAWRRKESR